MLFLASSATSCSLFLIRSSNRDEPLLPPKLSSGTGGGGIFGGTPRVPNYKKGHIEKENINISLHTSKRALWSKHSIGRTSIRTLRSTGGQ